MNAATLLRRPVAPLSKVYEISEKQQREFKAQQAREDLARDLAERGPALTAAAAVSERYGRLCGRLRDMVERAESSWGNDREAELVGDLEDLERLVGEALRGAA